MIVLLPSDLVLLLLALQPAAGPDERALAERIRDGDRASFRVFFDLHHGRLYGFLRRRGVAPAVCDDLVQTAFVAVWERRAQIDPSRSLRALLYRIAYTRALNHFRDTSRLEPLGDLDDLTGAPGYDAAAPDRDTAAGLVERQLHRAVAALPERRRAVFEMCFLQELTYREAAEVLGIEVKTVENQMGRALKSIRASLSALHTRG